MLASSIIKPSIKIKLRRIAEAISDDIDTEPESTLLQAGTIRLVQVPDPA